MKVILDELNAKEFFNNGGVVKLKINNQELANLTGVGKKITFIEYKRYVRFMRELYLKYIAKHSDRNQSDIYEMINESLELDCFIGDKKYTLDPEYDMQKSIELCLFYFCGENDVYDFKNSRDPYGICNVNFSTIDETDSRWDECVTERLERGFDHTELWSLDSTISKFILPRLKAFRAEGGDRKVLYGCDEDFGVILDKMISGFELLVMDHEKSDEEEDIIEEALDLFRKWYRSLWY